MSTGRPYLYGETAALICVHFTRSRKASTEQMKATHKKEEKRRKKKKKKKKKPTTATRKRERKKEKKRKKKKRKKKIILNIKVMLPQNTVANDVFTPVRRQRNRASLRRPIGIIEN